MTQRKKLNTASLQDQLIHALKQLQKIPGMKTALELSIKALGDKSRTHVPEGDYKNIALFKDRIFEEHQDKIKTAKDEQNVKALIDLANTHLEEKPTFDKKTRTNK